MKLQAQWERWKERNRFGGDVHLAGHAGEAFNHAHRDILEAHPEFLSEVDGKRQPWGVTTKLCTSNTKVRELWVADRLKKLEQDMTRFPNDPRSSSVSTEPADGGGHCECKRCLQIGSASDRVFVAMRRSLIPNRGRMRTFIDLRTSAKGRTSPFRSNRALPMAMRLRSKARAWMRGRCCAKLFGWFSFC